MSRLKIQNKVKFWGKASTLDDNWTPWSGLSTVALVIVQAIASAAWANLILLWLLRPRMQWSVMFLYSILGNQYQRSAKDYLFADGILTLLGIPIAAWLLEATLSSYACANEGGNTFNKYVLGFGTFGNSGNTLGLLKVALYLCLAFSGADLFIFAAFCVKRRLSRGWAVGAGIWSMMIFGIAWYFWIGRYWYIFIICADKALTIYSLDFVRRNRFLCFKRWGHHGSSCSCSIHQWNLQGLVKLMLSEIMMVLKAHIGLREKSAEEGGAQESWRGSIFPNDQSRVN